jgi:uncharacterized protein
MPDLKQTMAPTNMDQHPDNLEPARIGLVERQRLSFEQASVVGQVLGPFAPAVTYVFGSYGMPFYRRDSDLDIAFLPKAPVDAVEIFEAAGQLSGKLGIEVDLVDLTRASTVMGKEVIRTGQVIHIHDERAMREFEMRTLSAYARLNEERHEVLAAI